MELMRHLFAFFVLITGVVRSDLPTVTVTVSHSVARVGELITVTCTVMESGTSYSTFTFTKAILQDEQKLLTENIAINEALTNPYSNSGRFSVRRTTDGSSQVIILYIRNATVEDSGSYVCAPSPSDNLFGSATLDIYRLPINVTFEGYSSHSTVVMAEGERAKLVCRVPDVVPVPDVKLILEREILGTEDITDRFLVSSDLNTFCTESQLNKKCLMHFTHTMIAENKDFSPSFLNDGKKLTCSAKMRHLEQDEISTTITLNVTYAPRIICPDVWNATVNMTDLRITCQLHANPPAFDNKTVSIHTRQNRILLLYPGNKTDEYEVTDTHQIHTDSKASVFVLNIKFVTEDHLANNYYIYAQNAAGNTTKKITIKLIETYFSGADSRISGQFFVLLLSIFMLVSWKELM